MLQLKCWLEEPSGLSFNALRALLFLTFNDTPMMERIILNSASQLKSVIFAGLKAQEYELVHKTYVSHPSYLFYHAKTKNAAIYNCKLKEDELILFDTKNPEKLKIVINEILRYGKEDFNEIAARLSEISNAKQPSKVQVIYLSQI